MALFALAATVKYRRRQPQSLHVIPAVALGLTIAGALLSLTTTDNVRLTSTLIVVGIVCPIAIAYALIASDVPHDVIALAFLVMVGVLLLRADVVFLLKYGLPTPSDLFRAKFSNAPYDFHYYTLNNPDQTSVFLVLPLGLAAFWSIAPSISTRLRALLAFCALLVFANLVLVYARVGIAIALVIVVTAAAMAPGTVHPYSHPAHRSHHRGGHRNRARNVDVVVPSDERIDAVKCIGRAARTLARTWT